mgnify:CR=1 FL=1
MCFVFLDFCYHFLLDKFGQIYKLIACSELQLQVLSRTWYCIMSEPTFMLQMDIIFVKRWQKNKSHLFSLDVWLCLAMVIIILVNTIYSGNTTILYCLHHIIPSCIHCSTISSAKTSYFLFNTNLFSLFLCHIILFIYSVPYNIHIVSYYNINLFDKISSDGG